MSDRLDLLDYYTLLGVEPDASADEIRDAYHTFALKFHPDRHVGGTDRKTSRAATIFRRGAEAYRILSEPRLRAEYDLGLKGGELRLSAAPPPSGGPSMRPGMAPMSARARPFYQKALQNEKAGNRKGAMLNAKIALGHAPGHASVVLLIKRLSER